MFEKIATADARRLLWLMIHSNDGYVLERSDIEGYPGDERAMLHSTTDEITGNVRLAATCIGNNVAESDRPQRIQRRRTAGWRMPPNTVYVGRPSKWGNPIRIGQRVKLCYQVDTIVETAAQAVTIFEARANDRVAGFVFRRTVRRELRGKNLACWCRLDQPCHADVLLEIANG